MNELLISVENWMERGESKTLISFRSPIWRGLNHLTHNIIVGESAATVCSISANIAFYSFSQ